MERSVESLSERLTCRARCKRWEEPNLQSWEQASALGWWWRSHLNSGNGDNDDASAQGIMQII